MRTDRIHVPWSKNLPAWAKRLSTKDQILIKRMILESILGVDRLLKSIRYSSSSVDYGNTWSLRNITCNPVFTSTKHSYVEHKALSMNHNNDVNISKIIKWTVISSKGISFRPFSFCISVKSPCIELNEIRYGYKISDKTILFLHGRF